MSAKEAGRPVSTVYFINNDKPVWSPTDNNIWELASQMTDDSCSRIAATHATDDSGRGIHDKKVREEQLGGLATDSVNVKREEFGDELDNYESRKLIVKAGASIFPAFFIR